MLGGGRSGGVNGCSTFPFTPTQYEELNNQALIYNYMASGSPVPSHLLLPIRRSFLLDTPLAMATSAFPPQPSLGWGCFQLGYGRKPEDPEPGRCRRTDGKKWRCSKEAYPDSKYCEKHMHRGKNRSRKPVDMSLATPAAAASSSSPSPASAAAISAAASSTSIARPSNHEGYHHVYPYGIPSRAPAASLHLPHYYGADCKDYSRYVHGMKEVDEHSFFSDLPDRESPWQQQQQQKLGMNGGGYLEPKLGSNFYLGSAYSAAAAYQTPIDLTKEDSGTTQEDVGAGGKQHCFLLGADLRLNKPSGGVDSSARRPLRHFFDEWPLHEKSNKDSWMGLDGETQLSISIPMAGAADIPISASGFHHDN